MPDAIEKISWQMPTFWKGRNLIHFVAQGIISAFTPAQRPWSGWHASLKLPHGAGRRTRKHEPNSTRPIPPL